MPLQSHLDFLKAMESEHERGPCFQDQNHPEKQIEPKREFLLVVGLILLERKTSRRKMPNIDTLLCSNISQKAKLRREEVMGIVLYTGPMHYAYNRDLRSPFCLLYATTIFAITSAIVKLTRVQHIPSGSVVYRGLGGNARFPEFFYHSDSLGSKGIIAELAFMSTTKNWETAIKYSGVTDKDKKEPTVLEIQMTSIDRGADIEQFSQYAHEGEIQWTPSCFLEVTGAREEATNHGSIKVIEVCVNCNKKVLTIDELLLMRKSIHLQTFDNVRLMFYTDEVKERLQLDKTQELDEDIGSITKVLNQYEKIGSRERGLRLYQGHPNFSKL